MDGVREYWRFIEDPAFSPPPLPQAPPLPTVPPVSCLSFSVFLRVCVADRAYWRERGYGGGEGAKSYDGEKVWSSISHRCKKVSLTPFLLGVMIVSLALSITGWSSHRHKSAAWHKPNMVWLYCSPIPAGRRGIFSFIPAFAALWGDMPNMIVSYKGTSSILNLRNLSAIVCQRVCFGIMASLHSLNSSLEGKWCLLSREFR
jgi:hypothetical protein